MNSKKNFMELNNIQKILFLNFKITFSKLKKDLSKELCVKLKVSLLLLLFIFIGFHVLIYNKLIFVKFYFNNLNIFISFLT